jgi:glycosyltransferase involved in cell wall biosynthesis
MKIVCISAAQIPSDSANSIQVMKVCQAFVQMQHEVTLLVPGNQPTATGISKLREHYGLDTLFPIRWLSLRSRRLFPWNAVWEAHRLGADMIYCWPLQSATLGLLTGMPAMLELHDLPAGRFGPFWLRLFLRVPGRKRLLPITAALRHALGLPDASTVTAPDGVDLERYASLPIPESSRSQLGLPPALTVLCTGHLYAGRGADLFLELAKKFPQASFVWVGGRPADLEIWKQRAVGLANVTFTGFVPNERIPLYQSAADVLLMPYQRAVATSSGGNTADICSPMKMFEYMGAGRAILSSDLPVLHEVLDETMAIFCPLDNTNAWESALAELLSDEGRRKALGQRAKLAVEQYSWKKRAQRVLEGFYEIPA